MVPASVAVPSTCTGAAAHRRGGQAGRALEPQVERRGVEHAHDAPVERDIPLRETRDEAPAPSWCCRRRRDDP